MKLKLIKTKDISPDITSIILVSDPEQLKPMSLSPTEFNYIKSQFKDKKEIVEVNSYFKWTYIIFKKDKDEQYLTNEQARKNAHSVYTKINENKIKDILLIDKVDDADYCLSFSEGLLLSNYQFIKYFKDKKEKKHTLECIHVFSDSVKKKELEQLQNIAMSVYTTRDLVNEPLSYLTAVQLAEDIKKIGKDAGFKVEVLNKKQIQSLKLNGLLAVNKGSIDPPTFSILEWKPEKAKNSKPYVLVGKGVVYDTGGLSLKPTNYMDTMKSDMAGAASVIGTMAAIAKNKIPVHIIGLIPATDNRPDGNAYAPGDVIKMHNGITVEVLNTDAEGRMLLADALSFAKQYEPELVIDLATLTGSASMAVGSLASVAMGNVKKETFDKIKESGFSVYERIVEFPFWEEYKEMLKSDIADIKNIGGREGGAITAGKFLEHFVDYPWIHLDIAGPAFLEKPESYRGKGASGVGVRLLYDYFKKI